MPRVCTACTHPRRAELDRALVGGEPYRRIAAGSGGLSESALRRHRAQHLPRLLARAEHHERARGAQLQAAAQARESAADAEALDVMGELRRCLSRVNLLFDACDRWLRDPEHPERYDVGPRSEDVSIVFSEAGADGKPVLKKAKLSALLARLEQAGLSVHRGEFRHADPRELVLKTHDRLQGTLELVAKLLGDLDERPTINLVTAPEWPAARVELLQALAPFPEARAAAAACLVALEAA